MPDTYVDPYFSLPQLFFDQFQIQLKNVRQCTEVSESGRGVRFIIWVVHLDELGPVGSLSDLNWCQILGGVLYSDKRTRSNLLKNFFTFV